MKNLEDLEKKINSELTTKINKTEIKHNQIYLDTDKDDLIDIIINILHPRSRGTRHLTKRTLITAKMIWKRSGSG